MARRVRFDGGDVITTIVGVLVATALVVYLTDDGDVPDLPCAPGEQRHVFAQPVAMELDIGTAWVVATCMEIPDVDATTSTPSDFDYDAWYTTKIFDGESQ